MVELPIRAIQVDVKGAETEDADRLDLSPETDVRLNGLRVLVVDDEADARRLVVKFLSEAGATAMAAATPAEALRILESFHANVLVSDLAMPDEDGFDLIRQVRDAGYSVQELPQRPSPLTPARDSHVARCSADSRSISQSRSIPSI
jgi:CheY-like chemotaxis protein